MVSITKCIEIYKKHGIQITEPEAEKLRHLLYLMAEINWQTTCAKRISIKSDNRKNKTLNL